MTTLSLLHSSAIRSMGLASVLAVGGLLAPNVADAQSGAIQSLEASPVIFACYVPKSGTVYRIKTPSTPAACLSGNHIEFSWNQQGIPGEQGDPGEKGDPGGSGAII